MKQQPRPIVGIDLGTTNSAVAFIEKGVPRIIPSPRGEKIIPSVVMIDLEENILIGEAARSSQVVMPERVTAAAKRKMGSTEPITMAGRQFLPQEISAMILKELKSYADTMFGEGEKEAVITVPAYFTDEQRRATKQAGELAGFVVERIINEPTAAALAFGLQNLAENGNILVYDLGGGTFDVSVVEMMSGVLEVKASAGNNMLGGEDFDWLLAGWLAEKIRKKHGFDPLEDIRAKNLLKEQAEKIKMELSAAEKTTVHLPVVAMKKDKPVGLTTEITRRDFVALIEGHLAETMDCVRKVLQDASLKPSDIQEILLVGGSTRIPRVQELIVEFFRKEPRRDINPDEAVALGASVQAGLKAGLLKKSGLIVTDVAPFSLGVAVVGEHRGSVRSGIFSVIIPRNTTVPVRRSECFTTSAPGQTEAKIEIYQGEHELTKYNHSLGEFMLSGIPASWQKPQKIEVTYSYNLNGILEVTATVLANKKQERLTVHDTLARDTEESFAQSAEKLRLLYENVPQEEDEDANEEDDFFGIGDIEDIDDIDDAEFEADAAKLRQELKSLQKILSRKHKALNDTQRQNLKEVASKLEQILAVPDSDPEIIKKFIEEATDILIDLEFAESDS